MITVFFFFKQKTAYGLRISDLCSDVCSSDLRLLDPDARVARCLAELFNPLLYPGMGMRLTITQEEVGYLARVSRQRANQALGKLEEAGLLRVEYGAVRVLDLDGLKGYGDRKSTRLNSSH